MQELVDYLHRNVPITEVMRISAGTRTEASLSLRAPLAPNINDKQSVFGGTLASLCTLTAWAVASLICREAKIVADLGVAESQIRYLTPVRLDWFEAVAQWPDVASEAAFIEQLQNQGCASITLDVSIDTDGQPSVEFNGRFFAHVR